MKPACIHTLLLFLIGASGSTVISIRSKERKGFSHPPINQTCLPAIKQQRSVNVSINLYGIGIENIELSLDQVLICIARAMKKEEELSP